MKFMKIFHWCCIGRTALLVRYKTLGMKAALVPALAFVVMSFACCKKESCDKDDDGLVALKVLRYDCDRVIFSMETNAVTGDSQWTDVQTGQVYQNVVYYTNTCEVARVTNGAMTTVYAKVETTTDNSFPDNCVQCLAVSQHPPQTKVKLTF